MAGVDYSRVARVYQCIEYLAFGRLLEKVRGWCLDRLELEAGSRVLLVGDGDGRFLEMLLERFPNVQVDYLESSVEMIESAKNRAADDGRVQWCLGDVREWSKSGYDLVAGHFVLDAFSESERGPIVAHLVSMLSECGEIVVSDFSIPVTHISKIKMWVMQWFFFVFAAHPRWEVFRDDKAFWRCGVELNCEESWDKGWIYTQIWKNS